MSVKDKLGRAMGARANPPDIKRVAWEGLGFTRRTNPAGEFLVREVRGEEEICFHELPAWVWGLVGKDHSLEQFDAEAVCFLDLETTGLNLGAGGFAFTIGVGYLDSAGPVIRQYFLRDHRDERAALYDLAQFLEQFQGLGSYNGKSFDWPLLCDRFHFHRLSFPSLDRAHLDLLHAARRLWKGVLTGFSLKEVELHILNKARVDDIPGYMIPAAYVNFLRTGEVRDIHRILKHNQLDVTNLMVLARRMGEVFLGIEWCEFRQEVVNAADIFAWQGDFTRAIDYLETVLGGTDECDQRVLCSLARLHKRVGDYTRAVGLWQEAVIRDSSAHEPWIELAKHFEHREKDMEAALRCTLRAVETNQGRVDPRLQKRLNRIKWKLTRESSR
ncbi:MAG: tetratricopeptide repeat protein [Syntrophomonadaceae bacterium]|nr:tetratricopeptide repeat protein [Syntrophomonadaceae bacterium]